MYRKICISAYVCVYVRVYLKYIHPYSCIYIAVLCNKTNIKNLYKRVKILLLNKITSIMLH